MRMATYTHSENNQSCSRDRRTLSMLPYDLLFNISQHLSLCDVIALQLTCKSMHDFVCTRPVYRDLAMSLLRRCRALPLAGFQKLSDLSTEQLKAAVARATRIEHGWLSRGPKPSKNSPYTTTSNGTRSWYKVISAPPNEEVDWLSPITSSYTLCATRSGKVVCWDVHTDSSVAEWDPHERWELWKCRVEFDLRTVFFTMAKVLRRSSAEDRLMEFVLMKLEFPPETGGVLKQKPIFDTLAKFRTLGVVMNVFLLDPTLRLLSAFVWVASLNTIGLFVLPDWDIPEYVFVDTTVECSMSSNWSCILHKDSIIVHSEECEIAHQFFYPLPILRQYRRPILHTKNFSPKLSTRLPPFSTVTGRFIFPQPPKQPDESTHASANGANGNAHTDVAPVGNGPVSLAAENVEAEIIDDAEDGHTDENHNPFPFPPWYPESAHFVRQWWPSLPSIPKLSCTVILLADHDPESHRTRYVLAQHYFRVPLTGDVPPLPDLSKAFNSDDENENRSEGSSTLASSNGDHDEQNGAPSTASSDGSAATHSMQSDQADCDLPIWYVSQPFEVVSIFEGMDDEVDEGELQPIERPRPLIAVDFGHATWIEFVDGVGEDGRLRPAADSKRLRFVSFPPVMFCDEPDKWGEDSLLKIKSKEMEGQVRTLEIPPELDLDAVETINLDQSQGAIIISVKDGRIFILCYE
ncbi:hypothetical protein K474DRAFT_1699442 [Panus rudis PR-1116 ss-1]|nr:hypothetical protein K474DRAFT_1699442 [Panus rudis PR-1116 ss-1]